MKPVLITLALISMIIAAGMYFRPGLQTDAKGTAKTIELMRLYESIAAERQLKGAAQ